MCWRTVGQLQVSSICMKEGLSPQRWPGKQVGRWHGADLERLWARHACAEKHTVSWTSVGKVPLWPLGVMEFLRLTFFSLLSYSSVQGDLPACDCPFVLGFPSLPLHLATWKPLSFQRHPYSNFRHPWLLPTLPFVTIQLVGNELFALFCWALLTRANHGCTQAR